MSKELSKLLNGDLIHATLELEKLNSIPEPEYLENFYKKIKSFGYEVTGVLQDLNNRNRYHISIMREDNL